MNKVIPHINLLAFIFYSLNAFAVRPVPPKEKSNCVMMIGKHECPIYENTNKGIPELIITKAELLQVDSLRCNCNYQIIGFEINMNPNIFDAYKIFPTNKLSSSFRSFLKVYTGSEMLIQHIKILKEGSKNPTYITPIRIIIDSTFNTAYLLNKTTNKFCYGNGNKMKVISFLKIDTLFVSTNITKDRNLVIKSFNVEIITENEKKIFNVTGNIITDEIKTYILNRKGRRTIFIKDVISSNPDSSNRQEIKGIELIIDY